MARIILALSLLFTTLSLTQPAFSQSYLLAVSSIERTGGTETQLRDGRILVTGGHNKKGQTLSSVELYDPFSEEWITTTSMPSPRQNHKATMMIDGRVRLHGGTFQGKIITLDAIFDPSNHTWIEIPTGSLAPPRVDHTDLYEDTWDEEEPGC